MTPEDDSRLLLLAPTDNVFVTVSAIEAGSAIMLAGQSVNVPARIELGHKMAARPLAAGDKIIKYGVPIGSATQAIAAGEHIHLHNMQSDYLPTYTLSEGQRFVKSV